MPTPEFIALFAAGIFFLNGLLTGVWKYAQIRRSPQAQAHPYVDIAHRTSLMYSFAALLLVKFAEVSQLSATVEVLAVLAQVLFFGAAIATYMVHGILGDTENQLQAPHRLGRHHLPGALVTGFMALLILAEIGGFLVLFSGVLAATL